MNMVYCFNTLSAYFPKLYNINDFKVPIGITTNGAFFGIGAVVAGKLAKEGKAAQAIATMFARLTIANVIGVPIGTYLGTRTTLEPNFSIGRISCVIANV